MATPVSQGRLLRLQGAFRSHHVRRMHIAEPRLVKTKRPKVIMGEKLFEQDEQRTDWYRRLYQAQGMNTRG
jgi:hypothetical protein